ncbi:Hypothetical Protein RRSL_03080 [Ralstonia solanacearum UW551]|uniref:Uncharacterized protein n=1 Tax=Ralstonia solanacearum (strain UW551) TaxID=342110 RepID=A0AB33VF14_RALSU|nr:Hypothetical Protein RRSL_03080 [Ralstonia solanacearum UW551]
MDTRTMRAAEIVRHRHPCPGSKSATGKSGKLPGNRPCRRRDQLRPNPCVVGIVRHRFRKRRYRSCHIAPVSWRPSQNRPASRVGRWLRHVRKKSRSKESIVRSRNPVDPAVQRILDITRKAWQLDAESVRAARRQRAADRRQRIQALPQDSLRALAALALQTEIWAVRKTVVTVG